MKTTIKNNEFELVRAKRENNYIVVTNAIEKANYMRHHKKGTYELLNDGYLIKEYTYITIDKEIGFVLNNKPMTFENCKTLINMYQ